MKTTMKNKVIVQTIKIIVWGFIIPITIYSNFGLASVYGYIMVMAAFYNYVIREYSPLSFTFVIAGMLIVGYYAVILFIMLFGVIVTAIGA